MESTRQKTFKPRRTFLSVVAVLTIVLLIYPTLSAAFQYQVVRVTDGDTIKVLNNGKASTIRLVGSENDGNYGRKNRHFGLKWKLFLR
jgi:endonuclease YncB( thermonuclease family)